MPFGNGLAHSGDEFIEVGVQFIDPALFVTFLRSFRIDFGHDADHACYVAGLGLGTTHATETGADEERFLVTSLHDTPCRVEHGDGGAMHDALWTDIHIGTRRHLSILAYTEGIVAFPVVGLRIVGDDHAVGHHDARRTRMRGEQTEGMTGIHDESLLVGHLAEVLHHEAILCPVHENRTVAAIGDELVGVLSYTRVEVILDHQHDGSSLFAAMRIVADGTSLHLVAWTVAVHVDATVGVVTVESDGKIIAKLYRGEKLQNDEVDKVIEKVEESIKKECSKKIGSTEIFLDGERQDVRTKETNLGDFAADSLRILAKSDISLIGGGNIRKSIEIGDITLGNVYDVQPFQNDVVVVTAKGQDVKNAMEFSLAHEGETFGGYLQISGFEVKWDPSKESGSRVVSMEIDGNEMSLTSTYTVAMSDFLALGGDDNKAFVGLDKVVTGDQTQMFVQYIESVGTITQDTIQMGRIVSVES